jgi:hypothetical protein
MLTNDHLDHHNRGRYVGLTPVERQRLLDLHRERAEDRQADSDANLANALRLGAALKQIKA